MCVHSVLNRLVLHPFVYSENHNSRISYPKISCVPAAAICTLSSTYIRRAKNHCDSGLAHKVELILPKLENILKICFKTFSGGFGHMLIGYEQFLLTTHVNYSTKLWVGPLQFSALHV